MKTLTDYGIPNITLTEEQQRKLYYPKSWYNRGKKMAKRKMKEVTGGNWWMPEKEGEIIEGELVDKREGNYGVEYILNTESGHITLPSHRVLQARLEQVEIGKFVSVTYIEELPPKIRGHNPTKVYKVLVEE